MRPRQKGAIWKPLARIYSHSQSHHCAAAIELFWISRKMIGSILKRRKCAHATAAGRARRLECRRTTRRRPCAAGARSAASMWCRTRADSCKSPPGSSESPLRWSSNAQGWFTGALYTWERSPRNSRPRELHAITHFLWQITAVNIIVGNHKPTFIFLHRLCVVIECPPGSSTKKLGAFLCSCKS